MRRDDRVRLPRVAELPSPIIGIAAGYPVDLVRPDAGLVLAVEEPLVPLPQRLECALRHEPLLDDEEPVAPKRVDLLLGEGVDQLRDGHGYERGRVLSGS